MQLEAELADSLNLEDSLITKDKAYIQSTEIPYAPNNLDVKTGYDALILAGGIIFIYTIFHCIRKKSKE